MNIVLNRWLKTPKLYEAVASVGRVNLYGYGPTDNLAFEDALKKSMAWRSKMLLVMGEEDKVFNVDPIDKEETLSELINNVYDKFGNGPEIKIEPEIKIKVSYIHNGELITRTATSNTVSGALKTLLR